MKTLFALAAAGAVALTGTAASAETAQERGEAKLAQLIEGREAGTPQSCINAFRSNDLRVIENVGLTYEDGDTIYVARATDPRMLRRSDVPVFERMSSRLCRTDVMRTVDRYNGHTTGVLFLEDFVPYTKPANG